MQISRRNFLIGGTCIAGAIGAAGYLHLGPAADAQLTPVQAHERALSGDILLIDIRRPDEWAKTGIARGANPLDMRRNDFAEVLTNLANGDTNQQIAVMCARGVRSRRLSSQLTDAGFTQIIDVPEGMLGSFAGPGWLARDLPVNPYAPPS
ncbi:rhodanese-like domain-containing protein [Actibacterium sp. 188UL27-1]|uniref:rhodanese-like domain-containing protein n=1 Tax=Actibacterium sp. 188UL27-1 TaxID=2786961 RepID=UPI00195959B5|nr:rhodanese-like domain-containing protein [Actibacterium sp. 188UL27-1]MBM7066140.1 rhodanese-like domain-containing protein [Actibacterium sp. 188UL27-1]